MRHWKTFGILCLFLLSSSACKPEQAEQTDSHGLLETQEALEQNSTESLEPRTSQEIYSPQYLGNLANDDILLQLEYEPTFATPRYIYPYGRIPEFTLLADGRLFYLAEEVPEQTLQTIQLSPEDSIALLQRNLDAGIAELEDYNDNCLPQPDGTSLCIADAPFTILRQRMPDESIKKIRSYANFSNNPEILETIVQSLAAYTHPGAQPYHPTEAALFLQEVPGDLTIKADRYPLVGDYAPPSPTERGIWAFYLGGEDLEIYLRAITGKLSASYFKINDNSYQAELVPWLPYADYQEALEEEFPSQNAEPINLGSWLSPCIITPIRSSQPMKLRLVYLDQDDLYLLDDAGENSQESIRLTETENVTSFQLSPDGSIAYYAENDPAGARLWAIDLSVKETYPISGVFPAGQKLVLQTISEDNAWLALTVMLDDRNGELWGAKLDGAGVQKLVGVEGLRHENFPDCAIVPNQVKWIPGTHRLIYDGLPICDSLFIYMPELKFIDLDSGKVGTYPSGELVFSNDGGHVVIKDIGGLAVAQPDGTQVQQLDVPFFPIGMGEWWLYPQVFWENGDQTLLVVTSGSSVADWDNFDATPITIYRVPAEGGSAQELGAFEGSPWSVSISPNGQLLAYYSAPPRSNERNLFIAVIEDSETIEYAQGELLDFINWSPEGRYFSYRIRSEEVDIHNWLGDACGEPMPLMIDPVQSVIWLDSGDIILESSTYDETSEIRQGITRLYLAGIDKVEEFLVAFHWEGSPEWKVVLSE